jgi:hypothetical protein
MRETILEEAERLVMGPREADYCHPAIDYAMTAKMWTGILLPKLMPGAEISNREACLMMACMKISREVRKPKRDNRVDAAGYIRCEDRIVEEP